MKATDLKGAVRLPVSPSNTPSTTPANTAKTTPKTTPKTENVDGQVDGLKAQVPAEPVKVKPAVPTVADSVAKKGGNASGKLLDTTQSLVVDATAASGVPLALRVKGTAAVKPAAQAEKLDMLIAWAGRKGAGRSQLHESADLFGKPLQELVQTLHSDEMKQLVAHDPYLLHLHEQIEMNIRHVRMDAPGGRCAFEPSLAGLKNARDFFVVLGATSAKVTLPGTPAAMQAELAELEKADTATAKAIIAEPMKHYEAYAARIAAGGDNVSFPEFKNVMRIIELRASSESIVEQCQKNPHLAALRETAIAGLKDVSSRECPYRETIDAMQRAVAFFDIYERGRPGATPTPLYHSRRWQYHAHIMKAEVPQHILFPTQYPLGVTDLMKVRGVPLGLTGVVMEQHYADGFYQSPLEFWFHDINHSRRMWQQFTDRAGEMGVSVEEFAKISNDFVWKELVPLVDFKKSDPEEEKNLKRLMKVILFEIIHEDALPADRQTLLESLGRRPFEEGKFVFETLSADQSAITYARAPNAAVAAIVFRKLEGEFYDMEGMRIQGLGGDDVRTREMVAKAAMLMNEKLQLGINPETLKVNVIDDSGLPLDLRAKVVKRFHEKPQATQPLCEDAAMRDWVKCGERRGSVPFFVGAAKGEEKPEHPLVGGKLEPMRASLGAGFAVFADAIEKAVGRLLANDKAALEPLLSSPDRNLRRFGAALQDAGNTKNDVDNALWRCVQRGVAGLNGPGTLSPASDALLLGTKSTATAQTKELANLPLLQGIALQYARDAMPVLDELLLQSAALSSSSQPLAALQTQGFVEVTNPPAKDGRFFRADDGRFATLVAGKIAVIGLGDVRLPVPGLA